MTGGGRGEGRKVNFLFIFLVCLRKDVSGREGKLRQCLSSFITLITAAARRSVLQPFHAALFSLHLSFALQSFYLRSQGPLTGPVCLSHRSGAGLGWAGSWSGCGAEPGFGSGFRARLAVNLGLGLVAAFEQG